jgi:hypothetical protein
MSEILVRIERTVLAGTICVQRKSANRLRSSKEYLYGIQSTNLEGLAIYSRGKLVRESGIDVHYFLVWSKRVV